MNVKTNVEVILTISFKRPGMYQEIIDTMKKIRQVLIDEDWELDIEEELK